MGISTLNEKKVCALKPQQRTIDFILSYSQALEVRKLSGSEPVSLMKN